MLQNIFTLLTAFFIHFSPPKSGLNGYYTGLEKLCWDTDQSGNCINTIKEKPGFEWYYENTIRIEGDNVYMDQNPLSIKDKKKFYSASDGGFYYYRGTVTKKDNLYYFNFKELYCDYCPEEMVQQPDGTYKNVKIEKTKQLIGEFVKGKLTIDGSVYTRTTKSDRLLQSEIYKPE